MGTKIFVNIAVRDLSKSMKFFSRLGYKFKAQFTDKNAACMVVSKDIYFMLLVEKFFKTFTTKKLVDSRKGVETIFALNAPSRKGVDAMMRKVLAAGGKEPRKSYDYGWMYGRTFEDLDGHLWEVFYMDEKKAPKK